MPRVRTYMRLFAIGAMLACGVVWLRAEQLPHVEGENLLGQKMALPEAGAGHPTAVVIGFTHGSEKQIKAWAADLSDELPTYSIAVLEDAPRPVRGMAVHGMKSGIAEDRRGHFLVIYHGEKELKQAAGFDRPDDAYVLLLDKDGGIRWRFRGAVTDEAIGEVRAQTAALGPPAQK